MENINNGAEEEDEENEEEIIVYANFEEGTLDKEIFQQSDLKFKIIGLDSDTPVVQLGETTYRGVWNDTIGTRVFFEEDPSPTEPVDPVFTVVPPKMLKYKCMSTKTLDLSRIFLKPKNTENSESTENNKLMYNLQGSANESEEVLEVVKNTVEPDANTSDLMRDIVNDTAMDILDDNNESDDNG